LIAFFKLTQGSRFKFRDYVPWFEPFFEVEVLLEQEAKWLTDEELENHFEELI